MCHISVIMPAYNTEKYIDEAIESVLAQTFNDFELIIINDGSTDNTLEIAYSYQKTDNRIVIASQENRGLSAARNHGLKHVRGEFVYFMDSDDILASDALSSCINVARQKNLDLVTFSGEAFSDVQCVTNMFLAYQKPDYLEPCPGQTLLVRLKSRNAYSPSVCLYFSSLSLLMKMNSWFDEGYLHEDEGFTAELYCRSSRSVSLSKRFFRRRIRKNSILTAPHSWENVKGKVHAVFRMNTLFTFIKDMEQGAKVALRSRQRIILRDARKISEQIGKNENFTELVKMKFKSKEIISIDPAMFFYIRMPLFYEGLRNLWHSCRK